MAIDIGTLERRIEKLKAIAADRRASPHERDVADRIRRRLENQRELTAARTV